ncbi:hypothetical protein K3177_14770 [Qipengyuania sp. GH25]|uniref:Uncharacterized protein n=1 Tax=Qipengyuania pacifica TaxID=2860199 RepID=A0ABS7JK46_9SPHN|nr:hypothetical protein [Qipengyuania aerophila]MBX7489769.1 hypothetical protein [Qipengyuania aerophila]
MSSSRILIESAPVQKIEFLDDQMDAGATWANACRHEEAFRNVLRRMGFEQSFPMDLTGGYGFKNIAVSVLDCQQTSGFGPRLLLPIDSQSEPDEPSIEATLARSIGLMLADAEMYDRIWMDTYSDLQSRFSERPEASLERLDFVAGPHDELLLHAEFVQLRGDFSKTRSRRIASDIEELIHAVEFDLREHDRNFAALTVDGTKCFQATMTDLAFRVLKLAGLSPESGAISFELCDHPFRSVDPSLPFSGGSFYWSRGTLECSLEMQMGRCWIDGKRVMISSSFDLPATTLSSSAGRPLSTLLQIEGLEFDAIIERVQSGKGYILLEIEMPKVEFDVRAF